MRKDVTAVRPHVMVIDVKAFCRYRLASEKGMRIPTPVSLKYFVVCKMNTACTVVQAQNSYRDSE